MKKSISFLLTLVMIFCFSASMFVSATEQTNKNITEADAVKLAEWFIANDIYENGNHGWNEDTVIDRIDHDDGYYGNSYIVRLTSNGINNGYIVIGKTISDVLIKEFAYDGAPLFVGLVPLRGQIKARATNILYTDSFDQTSENLPYISKVRNYPSKYNSMKSNNYGKITDPYRHINDNYGFGWTYESSNSIPGFQLLDMRNFNAKNHCSLTTLTAIFNYHRTHGYPKIDANINTLFNRIKTIATDKHYYFPNTVGTLPTAIDNLATAVWSYYGYSGKGNNDFFFWTTNSLNSRLKKEIDEKRPGAISFTSGDYGDHTVTYYGYVFYKKSGKTSKMYLQVNDNWSTSPRYVDTTYIGMVGHSLFEICRVLP